MPGFIASRCPRTCGMCTPERERRALARCHLALYLGRGAGIIASPSRDSGVCAHFGRAVRRRGSWANLTLGPKRGANSRCCRHNGAKIQYIVNTSSCSAACVCSLATSMHRLTLYDIVQAKPSASVRTRGAPAVAADMCGGALGDHRTPRIRRPPSAGRVTFNDYTQSCGRQRVVVR